MHNRLLPGCVPRCVPCMQERVLAALRETEALCAAPVPRMLSFVYGRLLPSITSAVNYMPFSQARLAWYCFRTAVLLEPAVAWGRAGIAEAGRRLPGCWSRA